MKVQSSARGATVLATSVWFAIGCSGPVPASNTLTLDAESYTLAPGGEATKCSFVRATNTEAASFRRLRTHQTEGGHHVIVYLVDHPIDSPLIDCPQGGQAGWTMVYVGTKPREDGMELPDGVGFQIDPHQQFVIESHYINTSDHEVIAHSSVDLDLIAEEEVQQHAGSLFIGSHNIDVPARGTASTSATCSVPQNITVGRLFAHSHRFSTGVTAELGRAGADLAPFYESQSWEDPPVLDFPGGMQLGPNDRMRVTCNWDNPTSERLGYPDEMCHMIGIYWPANSAQLCFTYGGSDTCQCWNFGGANAGSGGSAVTLQVSRADDVPGVAGDPAEGRPVYCYLYDRADFEANAAAATLRYWEYTQAPLATSADSLEIRFTDVTPGEYIASCVMDTLYGGFFPGTGSLVNYPVVPLTVGAQRGPNVPVVLNFAVP